MVGRDSHHKSRFRINTIRCFAMGLVAIVIGFAIWPVLRPLFVPPSTSPELNQVAGVGTSNQPPPMVRTTAMLLPVVPESELTREQRTQLSAGLDPKAVGWPSEALSDLTLKQLKKVTRLFVETQIASDQEPDDLFTPDFTGSPLRPDDLIEVYRDRTTSVKRWKRTSAPEPSLGLADFIAEMKKLPGIVRPLRAIALKNIDVEMTDRPTTRVRASASVLDKETPVEWTATWECEWQTDAVPQPQLRSIRLLDYEEVSSSNAERRFLVDDTSSILGKADSYVDQLLVGMNTWVNRLERRLRVNRLGHNGLAIGDVNGDGRDDLYVCQSGGLPNRLYLQNTDGTARDFSSDANVDFLDDTTCALIVDLDNDGDQDLLRCDTVAAAVIVFANDGSGHFHAEQTIIDDCRNAFSISTAVISIKTVCWISTHSYAIGRLTRNSGRTSSADPLLRRKQRWSQCVVEKPG